MTYILGIDLGGTQIKVQAIDPANGQALESWRRDTRDGEWEGSLPAFAVEVGKAVEEARRLNQLSRCTARMAWFRLP